MPTRREFIGGVAAAVLAPHEALQACPPATLSVNSRLADMCARVRQYPEVTQVLTHYVPYAKKALVHWEWVHFHSEINEAHLPFVEQCQKELLTVFRRGIADSRVRIREVFAEGWVEGREETYKTGFAAMVRSYIQQQLATGADVDAKLKDESLLFTPVSRLVDVCDPEQNVQETRTLTHSAAAYCGVPYVLHHLQGTPLVATEDPAIDAEAAKAQWSPALDDDPVWVHQKRNQHFVEVAKSRREDISHFPCGCGHDLRKEAAAQQVSLAVVRTKSIVDYLDHE